MKVVLGFKSHSGWAAMVAIGRNGRELDVIDRRRIELIEDGELWAKQPYHSAEGLTPDEARSMVDKGIKSARSVALRRMREAVSRLKKSGHQILGCSVLLPGPMPDWTTDEILAVHFRMHKAEGVLFPDAICRAADACGLILVRVFEKRLVEIAGDELGVSLDQSIGTVSLLGKTVGAPWGKDQKTATLAAMIALNRIK